MQNASIPSNSIPQAAMSHLSAAGQGAVMLPNGAVAMVGCSVTVLTLLSIASKDSGSERALLGSALTAKGWRVF